MQTIHIKNPIWIKGGNDIWSIVDDTSSHMLLSVVKQEG